jgi:predicted transcriptional regulator of viral defense system
MYEPYLIVKVYAMRRSRHTLQRELYAAAEGQGGYFTAAQAVAAGYRYPQQVYQRRIGAWEPIDRGLFRLRDFPPGEHEDLIRWSLWSRDRRGTPQAAVSHDTAADLYGFGDLMPARIHLTVPPGFRKPRPDGCALHVARLPPGDIAARGGFRVTTPNRTVLDLAASPLAEDHFAKVLRDALRAGLVRRKHLLAADMPDEARRRIARALAAIGEEEESDA